MPDDSELEKVGQHNGKDVYVETDSNNGASGLGMVLKGWVYYIKAVLTFMFYWGIFAPVWYGTVFIHILFGKLFFGNQVPDVFTLPFEAANDDSITTEMAIPWVEFTTLSTASYYYAILIPTLLILAGVAFVGGKRISGRLVGGKNDDDSTEEEDELAEEMTNRNLIELITALGILPPTIFFVDPGILASVLNVITSWNMILSLIIVAIPATIFYFMIPWVIKGLVLRVFMRFKDE